MTAIDRTGVYVDGAGHGIPVVYRQAPIIGWLHVVVDGVDGSGLARGVGDVAILGGEGGGIGVVRGEVTHGRSRWEVTHGSGGIDLCTCVGNGMSCGRHGVGETGIRDGLGKVLGEHHGLALLGKHLGSLGDYRLGHGLGGLRWVRLRD